MISAARLKSREKIPSPGNQSKPATLPHRRRIRRSFAMWRFAAAEPFTIRPREEVELRRVVRVRVRRELVRDEPPRFALPFFFRRLRCVVWPPMRPARWNRACVAGVCCAKPAKPPGGTMIGIALTPEDEGQDAPE